MMQNDDPWDGYFYPYLTLIIHVDSYILSHPHTHDVFLYSSLALERIQIAESQFQDQTQNLYI